MCGLRNCVKYMVLHLHFSNKSYVWFKKLCEIYGLTLHFSQKKQNCPTIMCDNFRFYRDLANISRWRNSCSAWVPSPAYFCKIAVKTENDHTLSSGKLRISWKSNIQTTYFMRFLKFKHHISYMLVRNFLNITYLHNIFHMCCWGISWKSNIYTSCFICFICEFLEM